MLIDYTAKLGVGIQPDGLQALIAKESEVFF
jgi:hypothetical protein